MKTTFIIISILVSLCFTTLSAQGPRYMGANILGASYSKNCLKLTLCEGEFITPKTWIGIGLSLVKVYISSKDYIYTQYYTSDNIHVPPRPPELQFQSKFSLWGWGVPSIHFYPLANSRYDEKGKDFLEFYINYCPWPSLIIQNEQKGMMTEQTSFSTKGNILDVGVGLNIGLIPQCPVGIEIGFLKMNSTTIKYNEKLDYDDELSITFPKLSYSNIYINATFALRMFYPDDLCDIDGLTTFPLLRYPLQRHKDKRSWKKAKSKNTIESYNKYLENNEFTQFFKDEALDKLEKLHFKNALESNKLTKYLHFICDKSIIKRERLVQINKVIPTEQVENCLSDILGISEKLDSYIFQEWYELEGVQSHFGYSFNYDGEFQFGSNTNCISGTINEKKNSSYRRIYVYLESEPLPNFNKNATYCFTLRYIESSPTGYFFTAYDAGQNPDWTISEIDGVKATYKDIHTGVLYDLYVPFPLQDNRCTFKMSNQTNSKYLLPIDLFPKTFYKELDFNLLVELFKATGINEKYIINNH